MLVLICFLTMFFCLRWFFKWVWNLSTENSNIVDVPNPPPKQNVAVTDNALINVHRRPNMNRLVHYSFTTKDGPIYLGSATLCDDEDADDAFPRFFSLNILKQVLPDISRIILNDDPEHEEWYQPEYYQKVNVQNFGEIRAEYLLLLADFGFELVSQDNVNGAQKLLYKIAGNDIYYGRESTIKCCGLQFRSAA